MSGDLPVGVSSGDQYAHVVRLETVKPTAYSFKVRRWQDIIRVLLGRHIDLPASEVQPIRLIPFGLSQGGGGDWYQGEWRVPDGVGQVRFEVIGGGGGASTDTTGGTAGGGSGGTAS